MAAGPTLDKALQLAKAGDERSIFRVMVFAGVLGVAILLGGVVGYGKLAPAVDTHPDAIASVEKFDIGSGQTDGNDTRTFAVGDDPAGVVDFDQIPSDEAVFIEWLDDRGNAIKQWGFDGGSQTGKAAFPILLHNTDGIQQPGAFVFMIRRIENHHLTDVIARTTIVVTSG